MLLSNTPILQETAKGNLQYPAKQPNIIDRKYNILPKA